MEQKNFNFSLTLANVAYLLAAVALLMVLIPVLFGCWHVAFMWIHAIAGIGAVACAVGAYQKGEDTKKVVIALILTFFSFVLPSSLTAEKYQADYVKAQKESKKGNSDADYEEEYTYEYEYEY